MSNGILIWAEVTPQNYIHTVLYELASKSQELKQNMPDAQIMALIFSPNELSDAIKESFSNNGFDNVFYLVNEKFAQYKSDLFTYAAIEAVKQISPEIMLFGATTQGRDLAPGISTALHTGLTADCTGLDIIEDRKLAATRPTFGGQLMATILSKNLPQMATVRPKVFKPAEQNDYKNTEFIYRDVRPEDINNDVEIVEFVKKVQDTINELDSAQIIVAGGKGMKGEDGFKLLKQLADKLGGTVGASRGAVDLGYAPQSVQIGQTGKTVSPKIYIACAISGAIQHTCGIMGAKHIIAINKDENAPIFNVSDTGIVGDVFDIIPQMLNKLN